MEFHSDRATAECRLHRQLERVVVALVVECAGSGEAGELADCPSAVGVFGSAGEWVEEVDAVKIVVGG